MTGSVELQSTAARSSASHLLGKAHQDVLLTFMLRLCELRRRGRRALPRPAWQACEEQAPSLRPAPSALTPVADVNPCTYVGEGVQEGVWVRQHVSVELHHKMSCSAVHNEALQRSASVLASGTLPQEQQQPAPALRKCTAAFWLAIPLFSRDRGTAHERHTGARHPHTTRESSTERTRTPRMYFGHTSVQGRQHARKHRRTTGTPHKRRLPICCMFGHHWDACLRCP
jgi:hypothetical protein